MKVFLAWSGDASKSVARMLRTWLPDVIQPLRPFMSEEDIRSGSRWLTEVGQQLAETNYAILCATPDSLTSNWMHFEAGAAAKDVKRGQVCALLVDLQPSDVLLPLSQFQNRSATDREEVLKLLQDLNAGLPSDQQLEGERLNRLFERNWGDFQAGISRAREILRAGRGGSAPPRRQPEEILEELVAAQKGTQARLDAITGQLALLANQMAGLGALSGSSGVGNLDLIGYSPLSNLSRLTNLGSAGAGAVLGLGGPHSAAAAAAEAANIDSSGSMPRTLRRRARLAAKPAVTDTKSK